MPKEEEVGSSSGSVLLTLAPPGGSNKFPVAACAAVYFDD